MNSTSTAPSPIRQKALDSARRAWPILAIRCTPASGYLGDEGDQASDSAVTPVNIGIAEATANLAQLGRWFQVNSNAGIGLATGSVSGLWALLIRVGLAKPANGLMEIAS